MLSFDPAERPTSEDALADPYFAGLSQPGREPSAQPVSKMAFEFERRKLGSNEVSPSPLLSQHSLRRRTQVLPMVLPLCSVSLSNLSIWLSAVEQHLPPSQAGISIDGESMVLLIT